MKLLVILGCVACLAYTDASCFGRDAGFTPNSAKPVVSQPSRSDPNKVMVDWSKIVKNPQCVDSYNVVYWADGTPATSAKKIAVDKNTKSKIVEIQPCVGYRFAVETNEKNSLGMKAVKSGEVVFKTAGTSTSMRIDSSRFHVTYHWDPVKKVVDLRMATISFPREILPGASCLDYIQVTGAQARSSSRPRSSSVSRSRSFSWKHLGQSSPSIQVGNAATLPMPIGGARASYSSVTSGGARGPLANSWSSSSSTRSRSGSISPPGSPTSLRSMPSMQAPISKPNFANTLPRAKGGSGHHVGPIKVQPPFLNPTIEIKIPVQDCAEYNFEVKFFAPRSKEVGKVSNIKLPALADVPGYIPPPITSVMSITYGTNGKPVYGVKTASGVNSACLPAYFEAYDSYTHRLENEVQFQTKEGGRVKDLVKDSQSKLDTSQEELLRKSGCVCTSPHLELSTTTADHKKKHPETFGHYHFQGMHKNKPFYKRTAIIGSVLPPTTSRPGSRPAPTTKRPPVDKPMFLYWDDKTKQWVFGETVGGKSGIYFSTANNSLAKCPADPPANGTWQYKSSVLRRWKKDTTLKVTCQIQKH